ncbi:hypothetical protein EV294_11260 [Paenibacillus sp. BK033]|uniref:hypothetical protein n=1 Tax=Paenibacillus sp. BK033 TaxID=2512133 RepID=UPI0010521557|nr:hypothetical protein [Paenibacillus sp. BK033]TCM89595.1 hypothetical protein EV294_11260 [Paenibacillus sp. BK033]
MGFFQVVTGQVTSTVIGNNAQFQTLVTRQVDFAGKVVGQTWDVPHSTYRTQNSSPLTASLSGWTEEASNAIWKQDGSVYNLNVSTSGQYRLQRYTFDILSAAKRTPGLSSLSTVSDLRSKLVNIVPTWIGFGTGANAGASVNGITLVIRNNTTNAWDSFGSNTASSPSAVSATVTNFNDYIDANGFVHLMVYPTYPADGTNSCAINTDYVKLEFTAVATLLDQNAHVEEQHLAGITVTAGATLAAWNNIDTSRCDEYAIAVSPSAIHNYSVSSAAVARDGSELDASVDRTLLISAVSQQRKRSPRTKTPSRKLNIYITNGDTSDRTYYGLFLRYGVRGERSS